jgi:hypothetical protein
MDNFNYTFDNILAKKNLEIEERLKVKNEKMNKDINVEDVNKLNFSVNSTISKINNELDRKLKSSKAYKNKQNCYANDT